MRHSVPIMLSASSIVILVGVIVAFLVIIVLIRRRINFGVSLFIGAFIVALFSLSTLTLREVGEAVLTATIYSPREGEIVTETMEIALLMTLIYMLAKLMQETGAITRLITSLRTVFTKGGTLAVVPAIYGLMPVPGGALFSAPTVQEEGEKFHLNKNKENFLNIWFRHIWFPVYPISYTLIILSSSQFSNIEVYQLILANTPYFVGMILIGYILLTLFIPKTIHQKKTTSLKKDYHGLIYLLPPIIPVLFYIGFYFLNFPRIRSFLIGVVFSIIILLLMTKITSDKYVELLKKSVTWKLALAFFGIMVLREIFIVSEANVAIAKLLETLPFPPVIIVIILPLVLGLLTGYLLSGILLSYILVEPFFQFTGINIIGLSSLIFIGSFVGYLVSPIHLCNVLSSEYLKTDTTRMYKIFIPSAMILLVIHALIISIVYGG